MKSEKKKKFWENKTLEDMTGQEWERLCDNCGVCCLEKLEDEDTGRVDYTWVACRHLDIGSCRCNIYENRFKSQGDCVSINAKNIKEITFLPETCAYRLLAEGKGLQNWHYLISGDKETIHEKNISVRDKAVPGGNVHPDDLEGYLM